MPTDHVKHSDISTYAENRVNLPSDKVKKYRDQVRNLREGLEDYIREHPDYDLVKMYHSGSVAKGTALSDLDDMDIAVYIKHTKKDCPEAELLDWTKDRLKEVYPRLQPDQFVIGPTSHCVTISFLGSGLDVDVSPVIYEGDSKYRGYLINKKTGQRVMTSIPLHLEFIRIRKEKVPTHYAQIIRLAKWWVRKQRRANDDFRFKSFLVELICAHLLEKGTDFTNYVTALHDFFLYIVTTSLKKRIYFTDNYQASELPKDKQGVIEVFDPINPVNNVTSRYTEQERTLIFEAAYDALDAIQEARYATTKERAVARWQEVFGPTFNP